MIQLLTNKYEKIANDSQYDGSHHAVQGSWGHSSHVWVAVVRCVASAHVWNKCSIISLRKNLIFKILFIDYFMKKYT